MHRWKENINMLILVNPFDEEKSIEIQLCSQFHPLHVACGIRCTSSIWALGIFINSFSGLEKINGWIIPICYTLYTSFIDRILQCNWSIFNLSMIHFLDSRPQSNIKVEIRSSESNQNIIRIATPKWWKSQITFVMKVNLIWKSQSQKGELNVFTLLRIANSNDKCWLKYCLDMKCWNCTIQKTRQRWRGVSKLELNQTLMQKWNQHRNDIKMFKNGSNHNLYVIYNIYVNIHKGSKPMHIIIYSKFSWLVGWFLANGNEWWNPERETNIQNLNSKFIIIKLKIENAISSFRYRQIQQPTQPGPIYRWCVIQLNLPKLYKTFET